MTICKRCKTREGTETFVDGDATFMWVHGVYEMRCKICCLEAQIEHAKKCVENLPVFEKELRDLKAGQDSISK